MDWTTIIVAAISALIGGVLKSVIDKRKTPYQMVVEMIQEQKRFYEERNADYEREKLDSAEKSAVIMKSGQCEHRFKDPNIHCPVDEANNERLEKRCERCGYSRDNDNDRD